jgi:general stress protein 26
MAAWMTTPVEELWKRLAVLGRCMLVTDGGEGMHARPMTPMIDQDLHVVRFIADRRDHKDEEISASPDVCLAFADPAANVFVSVTGEARIEQRRDIIMRHWVDGADDWFKDGASDENAILIEVRPRLGQYWVGPSKVSKIIEFVRAKAIGERPALGESKTVRM